MFLILLISIYFVYYLLSNIPSIYKLDNYNPYLSTKIYDKNNNLISEFFIERRNLITIKQIPINLQNAFIAAEDKNFFSHCGISIQGIIRAFLKMILHRKIMGGGSTITQQLAKTVFLSNEKTFIRKIKELILTIQIERHYSKHEILQFYLNQIYFGNGAYGVQSAAKTYFNKNVQDLNLSECAIIASIPKAPNYYNPFKNLKASILRRNLVLSKMQKLGYITKEQEFQASKTKFTNKLKKKFTNGHYFLELIRIILESKYGKETLFKSGLSVYTTIDIKKQIIAEQIMENSLLNFDKEKFKKFITLKQKPVKVQGALIAIDPNNGAIRVMIGGRNFKESQFNRAFQAKRQPGSSFKPFVYVAAIEYGLSPSTILLDKPMLFIYKNDNWCLVSRDENIINNISKDSKINQKSIWIPTNYNNKYKGLVTLKTALVLSINTCTIELIMKITPYKVIQLARKLGISTTLANSLSLALGASDVTLQEMVSAFSVFASEGIKHEPYLIEKIVDKNGKVLEQNIPNSKKVLSKQSCFIITDMLKSAISEGSGSYAKNLGRPCAGKTGTTNNSSDVWFIGYTPQLVSGVWIGYDNRSMSLGKHATGGNIACPIWTKFMRESLSSEPIINFKKPKKYIKPTIIDTITEPIKETDELDKTSNINEKNENSNDEFANNTETLL
ncbi:MAG: transglycosylase domain-containing protein [Endomicrobium sp.]|nr:transglycosylase domain-containing protein [Endomicrobium sp.]